MDAPRKRKADDGNSGASQEKGKVGHPRSDTSMTHDLICALE